MRQEEHEKALPVPVHALHTTPMGAERIRKNLSLGEQDAVSWCREQLRRSDAVFVRKGKNWYVHGAGCVITINADSYTIITAHPKKK